MSADSPRSPRDVLEARLTAMLLGELSAEESASLQLELAQSPELRALHAELVRAVGLVGQAAGSLQEESTAPVEGLKLSSAPEGEAPGLVQGAPSGGSRPSAAVQVA